MSPSLSSEPSASGEVSGAAGGEVSYVYLAAHPAFPEAPFAVMSIDPKWAKETAKSVGDYIKRGCVVWREEHVAGTKLLRKWLDLPKAERAGLFDKRGKCVTPNGKHLAEALPQMNQKTLL